MPQDAPNSPLPPGGGSSAARAAAGVLVLQAVGLAIASVVLAVQGFSPETVDRAGAEILAVIGLAAAVAVVLLARGVLQERRWARSPIVVLELICLPIAVTVIQNDKAFAGIPLGLSALAVLVLMAKAGQLTRSDG
jgi:hypothetical protein